MLSKSLAYFHDIFDILYRLWFYIFDRMILYPMLKWIIPSIDIQFMNLGYWPIETTAYVDKKMVEIVDMYSTASDLNRPHYYLYEKSLSMHPQYPLLNSLSILEVGCGHGNGIKWIQRSHREISSILGVDLCAQPNQHIIQGDAHDLPFPNDLFDIILNVESSHLYTDCGIFFKECSRVLKHGGYLCWTDLRFTKQIPDLHKQAEQAELIREYWYDLTDNILHGIRHTTVKFDAILKKSPLLIRLLSSSLRSTYCAPGTKSHARLVRREKCYYVGLWKNAKTPST